MGMEPCPISLQYGAMKTRLNGPCRHRGAFTLIELLVVVSIIALLVSILLPALSAARDQAKSGVCKANLRTMGQAEQMFAQENDGTVAWTRSDASGQARYFAGQLFASFYEVAIPKYGDVTANRHTERHWLTCPSQQIPPDEAGEVWNDINLFSGGGYSEWWLMNVCYTRNGFNGQYGWYQPGFTVQDPMKLDKITPPASIVDIADGNYYVQWGSAGMTDLNKSDGSYNPAFYEGGDRSTTYRHQGREGLNVLLWDGHVEQARKSIVDSGFIMKPRAYN